MKKKTLLALFSSVCLVLVLAALPFMAACAEPAPAPAPAPLEIKFAHGWSTKHHVHPVIETWTKEVEEATEGRVKITIYPGGALAKGPELYDTVVAGAADMAWSVHGYTTGKFPLTTVLELPFMVTSAVHGSRVLWGLYEKFPEIAAEHEGVKVLWIWAHDTGQLMTTKKPVRTLDDIKGLKLRAPSAALAPTIEALGAVPVLMPIGELYDSLQKGVVDGTLLGTSAVKTFNLQDVIRYITVGHFFVATMFVVANPDSWASIPDKDREIIEGLSGGRMAEITGNDFDTQGKLGFDTAEAAGVDIYTLPADELAKWKQAVSGIHNKWIADMEAKGLPGQKVYDEAVKLAEKYK